MPRVHHVKKARKDNPAVKAGESYYWWKFRFGSKRYSATKPKRSQLTQSDFLSQIWDIEDNMQEEYSEDELQELITTLNDLEYEVQDRLEAMPQHLQDTSDSGILLQERIDGLQEWQQEIESIDCDNLTGEEIATAIQDCNPGTW